MPNLSKNQSFHLGLFLGIIMSFVVLGITTSENKNPDEVEALAVGSGHAEWYLDVKGQRHFRWLPACKKEK